MLKKLNKKGFTLAELLIVVAIIAVLVAIAMPMFTNSLDKARYAVHEANARSLKAMGVSGVLTSEKFASGKDATGKWAIVGTYDFATAKFTTGRIEELGSGTSGGINEPGLYVASSGASGGYIAINADTAKDVGKIGTTDSLEYRVVIVAEDLNLTIS